MTIVADRPVGEATLNPYRIDTLDRRALIAGLGACTLCAGSAAAAQEPAPPGEEQQIRLLTNLFTRVGAAVFLNGQGPFVFVIDTGAGTTAIADTVANQLALPDREPMLVHGITTATMTRSVALDRLSLGGAAFRNLRCPILPREQLAADGLLGLDVLDRFRLTFDVAKRSAELSVQGHRVILGGEMQTGSRIPRDSTRAVRGRFGQLIMPQVVVDGQQTAAFVDSGAQYSIGNLALRRAIRARRPDAARLAQTIPIYGVTGQRLIAELAQVDELRLGGARLGVTPLLFADLHCFETLELADQPALLIGADILSRFRLVTLDFPNNSISLRGLRRQTTRPLELGNS